MTNIQYGSLWPEGHFGRKIANALAAEITTKTDGRYVVTVTPPSPDEVLTKQVLDGELAMTSGHAIQDYVPQLGLGYLPYLYDSFDEFRSFWTIGTPMSDAILSYFERDNVPAVPLGYSVIGFRDMILNHRQIDQPDDFHGLRVRNDGSSTTHDVFEAFGADPTVIEYHKVKNAFAAGTIDAAANTSFNLIYMQWYEETTNVSLTSHQILTNLEILNRDFWDSLSPTDREIFRTSISGACEQFAQTAKEQRSIAIERLGGELGLSVNEISHETKATLKAEVEPLKRAFVARYGLQHEYDAIVAASH
ncbi:MAG: TRAP transporter substrate-binding protein [Actinomycetota bacterium]